MKNYENLKTLVASMEEDVNKFNSGNAVAGRRVRKTLQEIKKTAQDMRIEIQETKNKNKK